MYKHYARVNEENIVTKFFSDAFEQPTENDVLITETEERHFHKNAINERGLFLYEVVDGNIVDCDLTDEMSALILTEKIQKTKSKCQEYIYATVPQTAQNNALAESNKLLKKMILGTLEEGDEDRIAELEALDSWIDGIRNQSNAMELELEGLTTEEIQNYKIEYTG